MKSGGCQGQLTAREVSQCTLRPTNAIATASPGHCGSIGCCLEETNSSCGDVESEVQKSDPWFKEAEDAMRGDS